MYINFDVVKTDNSAISANTSIAPVNLFASSIFQSSQFFINNTLVSSSNLYNVESYLKAILSYSTEYKNNELASSLFIPDPSPNTTVNNTSFDARKKFIAASNKCETIANIFDDLFLNDKCFHSSMDLKIKFRRATDSFALISTDTTNTYKIRLHKCILYMYKIRVSEDILSMNKRFYDSDELEYSYKKTLLRTYNIAANTTNLAIDNIYSTTQLPNLLIIALMSTEAYNNKISKNPYNFDIFGLTNISVQVDQVTSDYLSLNMSKTESLVAYQSLIREISLGSESLGITRESFTSGYSIYCFRIYGNEATSFTDRGNLTISMTFASGATENVTAIILGQINAKLVYGKSGITLI